ncbi:hypothetical protein SLA2020_378360 [Shorea laevis]
MKIPSWKCNIPVIACKTLARGSEFPSTSLIQFPGIATFSTSHEGHEATYLGKDAKTVFGPSKKELFL